MEKKLQAKDLINVGIFTALYFVVFFATGFLGFIPIFLVLIPIIAPITTGIPFMLFLTKIKTFGMITIMSIIIGLLAFITGHTWIPLVGVIVCGVLSDIVFKIGNYNSAKNTVLGYGIFSMWISSMLFPFWILRESYLENISSGYGSEYANAIAALTPNWMLFVVMIMAFIGGIIGAFLGKAVLKKHFKKAGIV